jgi:hypothetical protein
LVLFKDFDYDLEREVVKRSGLADVPALAFRQPKFITKVQ